MPDDEALEDPFASLLDLEDQFYAEGFAQGHADGLRQSCLEAHVFGIEQGFAKFQAMGRLQARASIWKARLTSESAAAKSSTTGGKLDNPRQVEQAQRAPQNQAKLPGLIHNARLSKHVQVLLALVEPTTLSTANTDDAVSDFDDRLKRAEAKEKVIEQILGGEGSQRERISRPGTASSANIKSVDLESFGEI